MKYYTKELKKIRIDKGIRAKDLAEKMGLAISTVSACENLTRIPTKKYREKMYTALELTDSQRNNLDKLLELCRTKYTLCTENDLQAKVARKLEIDFLNLSGKQLSQINKILTP